MGQKVTKDNEARSKVNNAFFSSRNFLRALGGVFFTVQTDHWTNRILTDSARCQKLANLPDTYKLQLDDGVAVVTLLQPEDLAQLAHLPPRLNQAINDSKDHSVFQVISFDLHPQPPAVQDRKSTDLPPPQRDSFGPATETKPSRVSWWQWLKTKSPSRPEDCSDVDSAEQQSDNEEEESAADDALDADSFSLAEEEEEEAERLPPSATLRKRLQESLQSDEEETAVNTFVGVRASCAKVEVESPEPAAVCVTVANEVEPPTWVRRLDNFKEDVESGTSEEEVEEEPARRKDSKNLPAEWTHFDLGTSSSEPSPDGKSASEHDERKENDKTQHTQSPHARGKRRPLRPTNSPDQVIKRPRRDANKTPASKASRTPSKGKKQPASKSVNTKPTPCRSAAKKKRTRLLENDDEEEEAIL